MWPRIINAALGVWLMAAPGMLNYEKSAQTNDYIVGPLVVTFAVVAISETTRPLRWCNLVLGIWLVVAPWIVGYSDTKAIVNSMLVGLAVAGFSLVRGKLNERLGGGWSALWRSTPPGQEQGHPT